MKKWVTLFALTVILSCLSVAAYASTSSSLQEDEIANALKIAAGDKYSPPFAKLDAIGENVSTATGSVSLTQTDFTLQGKNGLDLVIKRTYSNRNKNEFIYNESSSGNVVIPQVGYFYQNSNGVRYCIVFESETQRLEEESYGVIRKRPGNFMGVYSDISVWRGLVSDATWTLTRDTTISPFYFNEWDNMYSCKVEAPNPYEIGSGWSLDLPYLKFILRTYRDLSNCLGIVSNGEFSNGEGAVYSYRDDYYRNNDGTYDIGWLDIIDQVEYNGQIFVLNSSNTDITQDGLTYNRIITDKTGKKMYFNSKGVIVAIGDRFGNRIKFGYDSNWKLAQIIDTYGRIINITTVNGMIRTISTGDRTIAYTITENGMIEHENISTLSVQDAENNITQFKMAKKEPFYYRYNEVGLNGRGTVTYNIKEIDYPTGAKTYYPNYTKVNVKYTQNPENLAYGTSTVYKLQARYDVGNNGVYNYFTYSYNHPYEGISIVMIIDPYHYNNPDYTFTGTITRQLDGYTEEHKYNVYGQKIQVTNTGNDGCKTETAYSYPVTYSYCAPATVTTTEYNRTNQQLKLIKTKRYQYDNRQNITSETEGNYSVNYTYDENYSILLTKSYKRDAEHETCIVNTLYNNASNPNGPLNGKCVEWERTYEKQYKNGNLVNTVLKSEKRYEYDTYGNIIAEHLWPSAGVEIINRSQYTYNSDHTWKLRTYVENVKDADNLNPHTVAQESYFDYYGNLWKAVDGKGNQTIYTYDKLQRIRTETNYEGSSTVIGSKSIDYIMPNNYILTRDENRNHTKRQFDQLGRLSAVYASDPGASSGTLLSSYQYDEIGRKKTETLYRKYNPSGQAIESYTKTYAYNTDGSTKTETTRDIAGNIIKGLNYSYQEALDDTINGIADKYSKRTIQQTGDASITPAPISQYYDKMGRLVKEEAIHNDNGIQKAYRTTYKYDFAGNNTEIKDARTYDENLGDYTVKYEYDYANHAIKETNILGNYTSTVYDNVGRVKSKSDYLGRTTEYAYDSLSRLIKVTTPFEAVQGLTKNSVTKTYYDNNGNKVKELQLGNKNGQPDAYNTTEYGYDARNRLIKVKKLDIDGTWDIAQYHLDPAGNKLKMFTGLSTEINTGTETDDPAMPGADNDFSVTRYNYNHLNQMISMNDPTGKTIVYQYDLVGNLIQQTDRMNLTTSFAYDGFNNLLQKSVTKDGSAYSTSYTYDITGSRKTMTDSTGVTGYTYDDLGRLTMESAPGGITKGYAYDANGNRKTFVLKQSGAVKISQSYLYDQLNRLKNLYSDGALTASYTYDANGNRDTLTYNQAGVTTDYDYNLANKLTMLTNSRGATQLSKYEYTYFYDGNQASKRETAPSGVRNTSYVYDGLGRLKQESVGGQTTAYTYDDFGNRSTMVVTGIPAPYNVAYSYDHNNRLLTETKTQGEVDEITRYGYDNNGNQIYKAKEILQPINPSEQESISAYVLGESEDSDVTLLTYDGFNQLIQVIEGTNTLRYTYNADGLRASKTVNGTTTKHIWDGSQIALELNAAGAVTNKYIRGINLVAADNTAGARSYYVYNGHGDTVQLTGASGNVIKSYEYDAFGNELNIDNNDTNVFRYAGEYFDKETGTIYLRARYYDPTIGRFITEDSVWGNANDPLSLNLYTYCYNNPINLLDPDGNSPTAGNFRVLKQMLEESVAYHEQELNSLCSSLDRMSESDPAYDSTIKEIQKHIDERNQSINQLRGLDKATQFSSGIVFGVVGKSIVGRIGGLLKPIISSIFKAPVYKAITAPTNRNGLRTAMNNIGGPPAGLFSPQVHHGLPWEFKDWFAQKGLNVNDIQFGSYVRGGGNGGHQSWSAAYSREWQVFINKNPNAKAQDIIKFYNQLRNDIRWDGGF